MRNFEPIFCNDGYRPNVGIVIQNQQGQVFWARRINRDGWQFPQGGVAKEETLTEAMYRELLEETGLHENQVEILKHTESWLKYDLPESFLRNQKHNTQTKSVPFKGQKQIWFLLLLVSEESAINLSASEQTAEFDHWKWVDVNYAVEHIVDFKQAVYKKALQQLDVISVV